MGLEALRRVQIGLESTRGTAVAADVKLMGMLTMDPTQVLYMPEDEERQSLALLHRREIVAEMANMHFESSLNFEQLIHFLAMGVGNHGSQPTTPTNGVLTRDWLFEPSHSASNAQAAYTLEYGDDQQEYESAFVMCSQLEFTWALEESVKMSAELFGRSVTKATFTSLSDPTIEDAVTQLTKMYVDTTWANLGTTQKASLMASATVRIPTGVGPTRYADGSLEFSNFVERKRAAEVEILMIHGADGEAEFDKYEAGTTSFIRLQTTGTEIEAVTPTYDKLFRVDLAVKYTEPPQFFQTHNGENAVRMVGRTFLDPRWRRRRRRRQYSRGRWRRWRGYFERGV